MEKQSAELCTTEPAVQFHKLRGPVHNRPATAVRSFEEEEEEEVEHVLLFVLTVYMCPGCCSDTEFRHFSPDEDGAIAEDQRNSIGWVIYFCNPAKCTYKLLPSRLGQLNHTPLRKAHLNRIKRMPCYSFYLQFLPQLYTSFLQSTMLNSGHRHTVGRLIGRIVRNTMLHAIQCIRQRSWILCWYWKMMGISTIFTYFSVKPARLNYINKNNIFGEIMNYFFDIFQTYTNVLWTPENEHFWNQGSWIRRVCAYYKHWIRWIISIESDDLHTVGNEAQTELIDITRCRHIFVSVLFRNP